MEERLSVLQCVVNALDDIAFAQHYLVRQRYESVLHVGLYASDEVYTVVEEPLQNVSVVVEYSAVQVLRQHIPHLGVAVVSVGQIEAEDDYLRLAVADEVRFKPGAPSHRPLSVAAPPFCHLVHVSLDVVADR